MRWPQPNILLFIGCLRYIPSPNPWRRRTLLPSECITYFDCFDLPISNFTPLCVHCFDLNACSPNSLVPNEMNIPKKFIILKKTLFIYYLHECCYVFAQNSHIYLDIQCIPHLIRWPQSSKQVFAFWKILLEHKKKNEQISILIKCCCFSKQTEYMQCIVHTDTNFWYQTILIYAILLLIWYSFYVSYVEGSIFPVSGVGCESCSLESQWICMLFK